MTLPSIPNECFVDILSFLDDKSLYECLFVNRYFCKFSIPLIWIEPFGPFYTSDESKESSVINTLIACLNEDEISSLIPCVININNKSSLFEYGKFVKKFSHKYFIQNIVTWFREEELTYVIDCRAQKLMNAIYHMIMRQGSNLQKFDLMIAQDVDFYLDMPKSSVFTTYNSGITNLKSLYIEINLEDDMDYQNIIEFLSMMPKFCTGIVHFKLWICNAFGEFVESLPDIIKLLPLEKMSLCVDDYYKVDVKQYLFALEHRSETLKELIIRNLDFKDIDLSFISKLEYLEHLEFISCYGFKSKQFETLPKDKFHLKELIINHSIDVKPNTLESMIKYFCGKSLIKLSTSIVSLKSAKLITESCPNINFLHIEILTAKILDSIPTICELSSLKILHVEICSVKAVDSGLLAKILADHLTTVEYLSLDFFIDLRSFEYFTNNCKAMLKKWVITFDNTLRKEYLKCVSNYQRVHNSLKVLGTNKDGFGWTREELKVIDLLKNQGVDTVLASELDMIFN